MIDLDNPNTYSNEIRDWVLSNSNYFISIISEVKYTEGWEIAHILDDKKLEESEILSKFIKNNSNTEFCVWHATRIENNEQFWENGIRAFSKDVAQREKEAKRLLRRIGLRKDQVELILKKMECYWKRDESSRLEAVHFFSCKENIKDDRLNEFAINLGGEIVRWALNDIDECLYKNEPFKRLWIWGKPSIIKFRCKLGEMERRTQENICVELVKYIVITKVFKLSYVINCKGFKNGSVSPKDILLIEEIENYLRI